MILNTRLSIYPLRTTIIILLFYFHSISAAQSWEGIDALVRDGKAQPPYTASYKNRQVSILEDSAFTSFYSLGFYSVTESFVMPVNHLMTWTKESDLSEYLLSFLFDDQESPDDDSDILTANPSIPIPESSQLDALPEELRALKQELIPYILAAKSLPTVEHPSEDIFDRVGEFPETVQLGINPSKRGEDDINDDNTTSEDEDEGGDEDGDGDGDSSPTLLLEDKRFLDSIIPKLQEGIKAFYNRDPTLIEEGEDVENLKASLHKIYPERLSQALKEANISEEKYQMWQREGKKTKANLKADPVVAKIEEDELSMYLLELQDRFQREGIHGFTCPDGFAVVLENINTLLTIEQEKIEQKKHEEGSHVRERLATFKEEVTEAINSLNTLTYINLMTLVVRFIGVYNALGMYEFGEYTGFKNGEMTELDLNSLIDQYINISTEKLLQNDFSLPEIHTGLLGPIKGKTLHQFDENLTEYLRSEPDYMVWPTVSDFSDSFFPKAGRYTIFIAGIQTVPLSFHDDRLMSRSSLFFHDFFHAADLRKKITVQLRIEKGRISKIFSEDAQIILTKINYVLNHLQLSSDEYFAVNIMINEFNHEQGNPLKLYGSIGKFGVIHTLVGFEESGIAVEEGFTFEHLRVAEIILRTLFPVSIPVDYNTTWLDRFISRP